jgi:hypothetical protein
MSHCPVARRVAWPSVADIACSEGVSDQIVATKVLRPRFVSIPCGGRPARGHSRPKLQASVASRAANRPSPGAFCVRRFLVVGEHRRVGWRTATVSSPCTCLFTATNERATGGRG